MIHHLLQQGKRVGITSQSWDGIRNLYDAVLELQGNITTQPLAGGHKGHPADVAMNGAPHFFQIMIWLLGLHTLKGGEC